MKRKNTLARGVNLQKEEEVVLTSVERRDKGKEGDLGHILLRRDQISGGSYP